MIAKILDQIENAKLDLGSSNIIEVRMEVLEELYTHIKTIEKISNERKERINRLIDEKEILNKLAKMVIKTPSLDTYI